jgi:alkanesulfonate monooxygenase SsuD/methylene tetrahydromethanopterin reductase-like flavin-dependent oxidoreductase (luciferase family)
MKVGLMLPLGEDEKLGRPQPWEVMREMALTADEKGLDSVWGADHLIYRDSEGTWFGMEECWTILSAVAAVTSRVEIGPLVLAMGFRNPALLAKMAATLDEVSGNRFVLGVGCGWNEPEFEGFDFPFQGRVGRFEEALDIVVPLVRTGRVSYTGKWHRADTQLLPPPRPGGIPVLIAGNRPRMQRLVARHANRWNAAWYGKPEKATQLVERIEGLREACRLEGRDIAEIELTAGVFVAFRDIIGPNDEDPPENSMSGTPEEVGNALAGYAGLGIAEVIVHLWPPSGEAVSRLALAAEVARGAAN